MKEEFKDWYKLMKPDRKYFWETYNRSNKNIKAFEYIIRTNIEKARECRKVIPTHIFTITQSMLLL